MYNAGIKIAGENRVQELVSKSGVLKDELPGLRWHMIGHLQTNKVRQAVEMACMIHSVDSIRLAAEIDRWAGRLGKVMDVLIEVNIAGEVTKYGVSAEGAVKFADEVAAFDNIRLRGLMCVAPYVENAEDNRDYFRKMRCVLVDMRSKSVDNKHMDCLSMGMSNDYLVAVSEGANIIRVGTSIFGERR
jgi:hypothetical protein